MLNGNTRTGSQGRRRAGSLVNRAERFSLGSLLGLGRLGGWTRALSGALVAAACSPALAGPEGAQVVRGNVDISRNGAQTLIRAGRNSIIDYRSFDIASGESVRFIQPDASSRVLNRITTAAPTRIDGSLIANGRVYIVNPAGVLFGNGASLNVNGLYAAAGKLSDKDFVRGINNFTNLRGEVVNQGTITADFVGLVGSHVSNMGSIVAPQGTIVMASGQDALIGERSGNIFVRVTGSATAGASGAGTDNGGRVDATGGQVVMGAGDIYGMAVRSTGPVKARNITIQGQGAGTVAVSGDLNARDQGAHQTGGNVDVLGQQISVINARIDASGQNGGGTVHIGGDYQGQGALPHAQTVYVSGDSSIDVNANAKGKGGTAITWSDSYTQFFGTATATGGAMGGDGGLIETSSHESVDLSPSRIDASAAAGKGGKWLIDPRNVNITTVDAFTTSSGVNPVTISPTNTGGAGTPSTVDHATIEASLNTGTSVIVTTAQTSRFDAGNIDVQNSITKTAGGDASLTLIAMNNITVEAGVSISSTAAKLNVGLQANQTNGGDTASGTGNVILNGSINTNGGTFSSSGVNFTSAAAGTINTSAAATGTITLNHTGAASIGGAMTAGGAVSLTSATGITLNAGITAANANVTFVNNTTVSTNSLTVAAGTGALAFQGSLTLGANNFTLTGDGLSFTGGANSVTGTGTLTLQPSADGVAIGVLGGAGTLNLTLSDLAALADGFGQIVIGRAAGTGTITLNAATFNDPVVIRSPGGTVDVTGAITGAGNASVTILGNTILATNIVTSGQPILITGTATLVASNVLLDTTNGGGTATGANITITGAVDGSVIPGTEGLTLRAGTAGDITLGGILGGGNALGDFLITSAHAVSATDIHATTITQAAGSGTATYAGLLDASAAGGINLTGTSFALTGGASTIATGAFNLTNSALTTISTAALNLGGAFTQTGAGAITLSTNITTTGDAVSFASPVTLGNNCIIDTTSTAAAGADITFGSTINATSAGVQGLTLNSGTGGNISLGAVGGSTRLGLLAVTNANNVTTGALTAFGVQQTAGGGTTQVNGAINTTGGIALTGNIINLTSTVTTTGGGPLVITNSGQLTLGGTLTLDGALTQSGGGPVAVNAGISTTNDAIGFTNNVTIGASGLTLDAGSSIIAFAGSLTVGANALTLSGNEINFTGGANSVTGSSALVLQPGVDGTAINVGAASDAGASTLDLISSDLAALANGFAALTIGRSTGSQAINISASTFSDPVTFRSPGGGTITVAGNLAGAAASDATITLTAAAASPIHLNANITTDGRAIQLNGPVLLGATDLLDSTNAGGTATGANIGVTGAIDATVAGTQGLTLRAGTGGDISLGGVTGGTRLGAFTITSAHNATTGSIAATTITQTAGAGTSSFGLLDTNAAGGVSLTGAAFTLAGANTTNAGTFTVNNSGLLTIGTAALTLDGAFSQTGAGATNLNQGISTTNDSITFAGNVTAGAGVSSLDAGTGTVSFGGTLALGANAFTIGGNTIVFSGGANSVTGTSSITLEPATNGTSIGIAGGAGALQLSTGTLGALANGFSQIVIGRSAGTHTIEIGAGGVTFQDPVLIRTPSGGSIDVAGNINGTDNATVTLTGATTLAANIVTAGQAIQINGAVTVNGLSTLDTTNGAATGATIGITGTVNGTSAGVDVLSMVAGTGGDITLGGAVGGTTPLGILDIASAHNVATGAVDANEVTQDAGTGTTTFGGLVTAAAGGINLTGAAFTLNGGAVTTAGGAMVVGNTGALTIANAAVNLGGAFNQTGAGGVSIGAPVTTTNDAITLTGPVTVGGSVGSLDAGTSTITINSTLALGANNFTLSGNSLVFGGGAASVTGTGSITLEPGAPGVSIGLGGGAGTFAPDLTALANGFSQIVIGRADGNGAITIDAVTFNDPVLIRTPLSGGTITVNGQITGAGNASVTLTGFGSTTTLNAGIVTNGNAIQINDAVILGTNILLDTTNSGGAAGANIGITGPVNGTAAGAQSLSLRAGTGDVSLGGALGGTTRLDGLTFTSAHDVTATAVAARSIQQVAGTGTTTFTGLLDSSFAGLALTTNAIAISGGVLTANGAGATLTNTGLLAISGAAWTLDGTFIQAGGGTVHLGANITTTNDPITFTNPVTMTAASILDTGAGAGDVTFSSTLDGAFGLTVAAGTGLVNFDGNVGATVPLGALTVSSSGGVTLSGTVHAASAALDSTGAVVVSNTVVTPGGFSSTGTTFSNAGTITTTNNDITIDQSAGVTINASLSAGTGAIVVSSGSAGAGNVSFGAAVNLSADSITLSAGDGTGTATVDALTNTPQFLGAAGGATSPSFFTFRQDAAILGANLPTAAQFGGGLAGMAYSVDSENGVVTVDDSTKVDGTDLTLTGGVAAVTGILINTDLSLASLHTLTGVTFSNNVTTSGGNITMDGPARTLNAVTLDAGAGVITFDSTVAADGTDLTLTARDVDLFAPVTPGAAGNLTIQTSDPAADIFLGGTGSEGTGAMHLQSAEIADIGPGFASLTIGRSNMTGAIHVNSAVMFNDIVTLRSPTTVLGGDILTNGVAISLTGDVLVAANVTLDTTNSGAVGTGANISITGTTNADAVANDRTLTLNGGSGGAISLGGDVGTVDRLAAFTAGGATVSVKSVDTLGAQNYSGALTLDGDLDLNTAGAINILGPLVLTVDATIHTAGLAGTDNINATTIDSDGTPRLLNLDAGVATVTTGAIGATSPLSNLTVTGQVMSISSATTTGFQTYNGGLTIFGDLSGTSLTVNGALLLENSAVLTGTTSISLTSTVQSQTGEANSLTVNSPTTIFGGDIGGPAGSALGSLTTDAGGLTNIHSSVINTTGAQIYNDAITVFSDLVASSSGAGIAFNSTLNSDTNARNLTINTGGGGATVFGGTVGGVAGFGSITTNADGSTQISGSVTTTGAQTYNDAVVLTGDTNFVGAGLTFGSTINSDSTPRALVMNSGSSAVSVAGVIGGTSPVSSVNITGATVTLAGATSTGGQAITGNLTLGGSMVSTGSGSIDITGVLALSADSSILTAGGASDHLTVTGAIDSPAAPHALTLSAGSGNLSIISNVGQSGALASLTATGANIVAHAVTTTGSQTYNGALTIDNNLTSSTLGSIGINGALKLDSDVIIATTNGGVTFNGTVDSGLATHGLTVNTGGGGITHFLGAVGASSMLTTLTTNADGTTRIDGGAINTSGDQTYADAMILGADTTFNGHVLIFQNTIDSDSSATPRALTANSSGTSDTRFQANVGSTARLQSITTNADGTTKIGATIATTNGMTFADPVTITGNSTIDGGTGTLFFQAAIDADSSVTDPNLILLANGPADADHTPFKFAASIGAARRLGGLTLGASRATPVGATAVFTDSFSSTGRVVASGVSNSDLFTITTGNGGFNMGQGQKMVTFGSINILTTGTATLGDLTALANISVTGHAIVIRLRSPALTLDNVFETPTDQMATDSGVDFVASGLIDFSVRPTSIGSGPQPTFSNDTGTADPQLLGFGFREFTNGVTQALFTDPRSGHSGELLPIDLAGQGPSVTSIASSIAGAIPRDTETREVATPVTVGKALRDPLQEMGVATKDLTVDDMIEFMVGRSMYRDLPLKAHPTISSGDYQVTVNRLSMPTVEAAVEAYRALVFTEALDANGQPQTGPDGKAIMVSRTDVIKDTIGEAWDTYSSQAQDADGPGFRAYLESRAASGTKAEKDSLSYLRGTHEVLDRMDALGLSHFEASIPKRKLMNDIRPPAMTEDQFQAAVNGTKVSMR